MKTILVDARIIGSGTGTYAEGILEALQNLDKVNKYILVLDPTVKWRPNPKSKNFTVYSSKNTRRDDNYFIRGNIHLAFELRKIKADIFYAMFQHIPFFYHHKNTIYTIHDLTQLRSKNVKSKAARTEAWQRDKGAVIKSYIRKLPFSLIPNKILMVGLDYLGIRFDIKKSKIIFTVSKYVRSDVKDYYKIKDDPKIFVVPNAGIILGKDKVKPEPVKSLKDKEYIFYIGNDHAHKNLNILLDALLILQKTKPNLHLALAGKKDRNYVAMEERAKQLGIGDSVHVLGFASEGQKLWLFNHTELYVFPSLQEGFGIPVLEAMAYGVPVVASDRTAIPEVCADAAQYFNPEDANSIAKTVLKVLGDKKLQASMIKKGYERNKYYTWPDAAAVVKEQINNLASKI